MRVSKKSDYTVIIPTMWVVPGVFMAMLEQYQQCDRIGEVLIINNKGEGHDLPFSKVRMLGNGKNMYVNPAWNLGASEGKCKRLIIANDDIFVEDIEELLDLVDSNIKKGMVIGVGRNCYYPKNPGKLSIEPMPKREYGWGCMMFMYKESYAPIPNALKIWTGDDWQIDNNKAYAIRGIQFYTQMSATVKQPRLKKIAVNDYKLYKKMGGKQ